MLPHGGSSRMLSNSSACPDDNRAETEEPWERKYSFVRTPVWKAKQRERMSPSSNLRCLVGASYWWSPPGLPGGLPGCRGEKEKGIKGGSCKRTISLSSEVDWDSFFLPHG